MIHVIYLARLREVLGRSSEEIDPAEAGATVGALVERLSARGGAWAGEFAPGRAVRAAVNQAMATPDTAVRAGDEVAFFPPVTGG